MKNLILLTLLLFFGITESTAQLEPTDEVYQTIMRKDSLLFDIGFNQCDFSQFENIIAEDFEFYHDKAGTQDKAEFLHALKNGLCQSPDTYQSRRELITSSVEIHTLYNAGELYGALQIGLHNFYETINKGAERFASSARFNQLWILEDGDWKLKRVFSFDHKASKEMEK